MRITTPNTFESEWLFVRLEQGCVLASEFIRDTLCRFRLIQLPPVRR
jgi:hypothetical protein